MSDFSTPISDFEVTDTLATWIEAFVDGEATAEQHAGLGRLLAADPLARKWFIDYMQLHASLTWDVECLDNTSVEVASLGRLTPTFDFFSTAFRTTLGYFPEGMPLGYSIGAVITGLALWIFGAYLRVGSDAVRSTIQLSPLARAPTRRVGRRERGRG